MNTEIVSFAESEKEVVSAVGTAKALMIENADDLMKATEVLSKIKAVAKKIEAAKKAQLEPLNEQVKEIRAFYKKPETELEEAERIIKDKMLAYSDEQERKAEEERKKLMARVERNTMKPETAMRKMDEVEDAPKNVSTESGAGVQFRIVREVEITDEAALPRKYLVPNLTAIRTDALAGVEIPGTKVVERKQIAAR